MSKFSKYAQGQWVVFYEKGLKDIPIQVVGNAAAAKKLMNKLKGKYKNIGRSERKDFEKDNGKIKESINEAKFSKNQIVIMRTAYGTLSRMDPSSPTYKKFIKFLEKLPKNQLKQLAGANIKWVSMLAKNRLRGESVKEMLEATYGQMLAKKGKKINVSFVNGKPVIKIVPINPEPIDEAYKIDIDKIMKHPKIKKLMQRLGVKKLQSQEAALKILNYFARNPAALAAFKKVGFESVEIKKEWG